MLFSFTYIYLLNVIKNKNKHISAVSVTLGKKMAEKENLSSLEKKMDELIDTQKKISSYFVDTSNIDQFVEYLENIGTNNGTEVSVNSVDFIKNNKTKILVKISIKGGFSETIKTIAVLENSPYNIIVNSLYLNKEIIASDVPVVAATDTKNTNKEVKKVIKSSWQADISFNVLNL